MIRELVDIISSLKVLQTEWNALGKLQGRQEIKLVGGSTFLELYEAFMKGKEIYLWNEIPEGILFDEISGFSPKIINGNLDLVK